MDVFDLVLKSDIINLLDETRSKLDKTKAVILIRITDIGELHVRAINLNDYETIGVLESAKVEILEGYDESSDE